MSVRRNSKQGLTIIKAEGEDAQEFARDSLGYEGWENVASATVYEHTWSDWDNPSEITLYDSKGDEVYETTVQMGNPYKKPPKF